MPVTNSQFAPGSTSGSHRHIRQTNSPPTLFAPGYSVCILPYPKLYLECWTFCRITSVWADAPAFDHPRQYLSWKLSYFLGYCVWMINLLPRLTDIYVSPEASRVRGSVLGHISKLGRVACLTVLSSFLAAFIPRKDPSHENATPWVA